MKINKTQVISVTLLVVISVLGVYYIYNSFDKQEADELSNSNGINNQISRYDFFGGRFYLELQTKSDGSQSLTMRDGQNGTERLINQNDQKFQYRNFVWDESRSKLFFISNLMNSEHISFLYVDINDSDPLAITDIAYSDPQSVINSNAELVNIIGDVLYINVEGKNYTLNSKKGPDALMVQARI